MWETQVWSLDQEDPLEKGTATHSSISAWKVSQKEEPSGLQPMGSESWILILKGTMISKYHGLVNYSVYFWDTSHSFSALSKEARFISVGSTAKCSADSDAVIKLFKFPSFLIVNWLGKDLSPFQFLDLMLGWWYNFTEANTQTEAFCFTWRKH